MATKKNSTTKSTTKRSSTGKGRKGGGTAGKTGDKLRQDAIRSIDRNLAQIDEAEQKADGKTVKSANRATTAAPDAKGKAKASGKATTTKATPTATSPQRGGKAPKAKSDKAPLKKKRTGILDVAATILAGSKEPMGCRAIVEQAIEKGLWSTSGKTPNATLYAAMIREIAKKGKDARFVKTDRGLFTARKAG